MGKVIENPKTYSGKEMTEIILRPRFTGVDVLSLGLKVMLLVTSKITINLWGRFGSVLMPYASGWQGGTGAKKFQKTFELSEFKAEAAWEKHDYYDMIYQDIVNRQGKSGNDISGTDVENAEIFLFLQNIQNDVFKNFWLGDKTKTHVRDGEYPDGTSYAAGDADKFYNNMDGVLTQLMADAKQIRVAGENRITGWDTSTIPVLYIAAGATCYAYATAALRTSIS